MRSTDVTDRPALTARSVIASTLLGSHPPRLPSRVLVAAGELFGIAEGTVRTALSRMAAAGEVRADDGWYELRGPLLERQRGQDLSREASTSTWDGSWVLATVRPEPRPAGARGELRAAMRQLKLAELREGVWTRPDNLPSDRSSPASRIVAEQCRTFRAKLDEGPDEGPDESAHDLADGLWDLAGWSVAATELAAAVEVTAPALEEGDAAGLADGFVLSAAVLRHLVADPLLPDGLLPADWSGPRLRRSYDRYDRAFKAVLRSWFRAHAGEPTVR